jgi:hypothetical protein
MAPSWATHLVDLQVLQALFRTRTGDPSLPWRFGSVTRVHGRSLATHFLLQIELVPPAAMRRETSRVSFLMCPFCVRGLLPA